MADKRPVNMHLDTHPANKINFKWMVCMIQPDTGSYSLSESATIETGLLDQSPMVLSAADQGKTKDVYQVRHHLLVGTVFYLPSALKLVIDDTDYVAKKLVNIGDNSGDVDIEDAARLLMADLIRLKRMAHF